ncbi:MAG: hypothetical protein IH946_02315 [Bacteroidetes bacterium]|nr:hypothetical protein [Bacteroidota bacterium]
MDKIKRFLPHLLAVIIFVTTSFIYFSPTIDGTKVLVQNDIVQYQKKNKEVKDYREATGKEALWTSRVFSGMPTFLMGITYPNNYMIKVDALLKLGMPHPTKFLFLSFVCYYFMLIVFGFDIWISVLGALMFGFGSYFFTILEAGHNTKALAIAYMAPVVAGFHLVMKKKYLIGGAIMVFAMALELKANHFQITYYLILLIGLWLVIDAVYSFIKKDYTKPVIAAGLLLLSVALGVGTNATKIWSTYDYAKHSIRGGESELQKKAEETKSGGLDFDYATRWSYGMAETFTLLIPNFYGGASRQELTTKSITYERMVDKGVPKGQAKSFIKSVPLYWGPQPFTSGPVYFGALACFLFVVGMFLFKKESPFYIWVVTAMVLSIMLSWGRHMEWFYDIFFTYFPFFNKFRVPSMILVVTQFVVVLMAITTLKRFISGDNKEELTNALSSVSASPVPKAESDDDATKAVVDAAYVGGPVVVGSEGEESHPVRKTEKTVTRSTMNAMKCLFPFMIYSDNCNPFNAGKGNAVHFTNQRDP